MERFGDLIRIERLKRRITQIEMAKKVGVSVACLRVWEAGKKEPGALNLIRITTALDIDWEDVKNCFL